MKKKLLICIVMIIVLYLCVTAFRYWMDSSNWTDRDSYISQQEKMARYAWYLTHPFGSLAEEQSKVY